MNIPAAFSGRVFKTKTPGIFSKSEKLTKICKEYPGTEVDVLYEGANPYIVLVFETPEDYVAFTLKYGNEYV